jgi:hypothetical protein
MYEDYILLGAKYIIQYPGGEGMSNTNNVIINGLSSDDFTEVKNFGEKRLEDVIQLLTDKYVRLWWELCRKPALKLGEVSDYWGKKRKEILTDRFISKFIDLIKNYPAAMEEKDEWKGRISFLVNDFIGRVTFIDGQEMKLLLSSGTLEATESFIKEAREFDSTMEIEDIGQAMRNVWIMNIAQMLLREPVGFTPSIFAYSMLYPYTDNYIDDADLDELDKKGYSVRFEKRLLGEAISPMNNHERNIFELVKLIEDQYPRHLYPNIYESLTGIHRAQNKSMLQHRIGTAPFDLDIMGISMEKGGASVLADAFLIKGKLTSKELDFFFAYGVMLQLCDDLQDVREDLENNHHTIFSITAEKWPLDSITDTLFNLVNYVAELIDNLGLDDPVMFKSIIRRNCCLLMYFAVAKNRKYYTGEYFKSLKPYLPYSNWYMKSFYKKLTKKFKRLKPGYNGVNLEAILMEAIKSI